MILGATVENGNILQITVTKDTLRYRSNQMQTLKSKIIYIIFRNALLLSRVCRFTIAERVQSYWFSGQPANRISSHYSAHVFSGESISHIDTMEDNGLYVYPSDGSSNQARYKSANNIPVSKM